MHHIDPFSPLLPVYHHVPMIDSFSPLLPVYHHVPMIDPFNPLLPVYHHVHIIDPFSTGYWVVCRSFFRHLSLLGSKTVKNA